VLRLISSAATGLSL